MFRESTHRSLTKYSSRFCQQHRSIALCCCWFVKQRFDNGQGQRVLNDFRGPGCPLVEWFGSSPAPFPPPPLLPSASCLSFSVFLCVACRAYRRKGGERRNKSVRKFAPLYIIQYSLVRGVHSHKSSVGFAKDRAYSCTAWFPGII